MNYGLFRAGAWPRQYLMMGGFCFWPEWPSLQARRRGGGPLDLRTRQTAVKSEWTVFRCGKDGLYFRTGWTISQIRLVLHKRIATCRILKYLKHYYARCLLHMQLHCSGLCLMVWINIFGLVSEIALNLVLCIHIFQLVVWKLTSSQCNVIWKSTKISQD